MTDADADLAVVCALTKKLGHLSVKVALERAVERIMLADAAAEHGSMPPDYWLPRHRAEVQLRETARLLEAFL